MPEYNPEDRRATVIVHNSWEIGMQCNLPTEKRWGAPFLQGKIIGIFNHAFGTRCWANDICRYDPENPYAAFEIFPSEKTIRDELKRLRYERMMGRERNLALEVERKTSELRKAKMELEDYSKNLEQRVAERTAELVATNQQLTNEIEIRKKTEKEKEGLISELQASLEDVKTLSGLLPICARCKKVRDDKGYWSQIESYIRLHTDADFSHSLCPDCADKLYGDQDWYIKRKKGKRID
jgi:hypothetical protein